MIILTKEMSLTDLILERVDRIARTYQYDFVYEYEGDEGIPLGHVVKRDEDGAIVRTPMVFRLNVNEEELTGEIIFYDKKGEFKRSGFDIENGLLDVLQFIDNRLALNFNK